MKTLKCFVVGDSTLTFESARLISDMGHNILGIFTKSESVSSAANQEGLTVYPKEQLDSILQNRDFDYLFYLDRAETPLSRAAKGKKYSVISCFNPVVE